MEQIDEAGLDELRLRQRCGDAQHRLVGKEYCSLGHRVDVAGEAKRPEGGDEAVRKLAQSADDVEFLRGEGEGLEELQSLLEPRRHQKTAMRGQLANEKLEDRGLGQAVLEISSQHIELVEIRQQRA